MRVVELCPNVLLLDFSMPRVNGIEVLRSLAQSSNHHTTHTILLSGALEGEEISMAFKLGARGVVLKDAATPILFKSIAAVMAGQYWVGQQSYETREAALKQHHQTEKKTPKKYGLTPREMEVLRAAVSGLSNKDIAAQYTISEQTVKHHITSIFDKLGVYNRLELTLFALHHKLVGK
jgi:DNA-binding NarL/FixJ family response regulator